MNALYESCHGYDEPTASNSTFGHPFASDASFTYNNNLYFNAEIDAMSLYPPITPSAHGARNQYMAMPNGSLITPQSQRVAQIGAYQYDSYNMSLQSSPVYDEPPSSVMPEEPAAPFHMLAYDGSNHSFSDDSNIYGADSTPTPKMRGMPMPAHQMASSLLPFSYDGRLIPTIELSMLQYKNFGEAEAEASGRTFLDIEEDDWHVLESNKEVHVAAIMAAFDAPFKPEPNVPLTATEKLRWVKYQTEQCEKVSNYLAKNETAKEASAWMLLEALLDIHKFGYKKGFRVADPDRCCSRRFAQVSSFESFLSSHPKHSTNLCRWSGRSATMPSSASTLFECSASMTLQHPQLTLWRARSPTGAAMPAKSSATS